jgi:hypothetical protein
MRLPSEQGIRDAFERLRAQEALFFSVVQTEPSAAGVSTQGE